MAKKKSNSKRKTTTSKKSTSNRLYYKGKPLNKNFKEVVKKTASVKKQDVSTPEKLKEFYDSNKEQFGKLFEIGLETSEAASSKIYNDFNTAIENDKEFFFTDESGKAKSITGLNAKFEIARMEHTLRVMFDAVYVEFSYNLKLDGSITLNFPTDEELEEIQNEPTEFVNDYLAGYGIRIIVSDPEGKKFKENESKRKRYSDKVEQRFKQFRREYNKERKSKPKRKK